MSKDAGSSWEELPLPPWSARSGHQVIVSKRRLILTGGAGDSGCLSDTWASDDDGLSWYDLPQPSWSARYGHQLITYKGGLLLLGGRGSSGYLQDAWMQCQIIEAYLRFMPN